MNRVAASGTSGTSPEVANENSTGAYGVVTCGSVKNAKPSSLVIWNCGSITPSLLASISSPTAGPESGVFTKRKDSASCPASPVKVGDVTIVVPAGNTRPRQLLFRNETIVI